MKLDDTDPDVRDMRLRQRASEMGYKLIRRRKTGETRGYWMILNLDTGDMVTGDGYLSIDEVEQFLESNS